MFKIRVPRVLAWSSDPNNPVEAEYIIEEKATGVKLETICEKLPWERKLQLTVQVVDVENRLTNITLNSH